jgi:pimeloyl-ACP methyl ester carboxylesterase
MSFPYLDETRELNDVIRKHADGSFIELGDGVTHYELSGGPGEIPVVLVHGFSVPYFIYDNTFDFLTASSFQVLRYDLYGRGFSDRPQTKYDIHLFTRQLLHLLDALHMDTVHLIGLSMGGPITTAFIQQHPDRVEKHILIDPAGTRPIGLPGLLEGIKLPGVGELVLGLLGSTTMVKRIASDLFDPGLVDQFQARYAVQMQYKGFKRAILSTLRSRMLDSFLDIYEHVGKLQKPTLMFWGRNDTTVPFRHSALLLKALPHAEFHAIEDCGHIPHFERPEKVNPILLEFLQKE